MDLPFLTAEDGLRNHPTVPSQTSMMELPIRTTDTISTTGLSIRTNTSLSNDTLASHVSTLSLVTKPDELRGIKTPEYRSFCTVAFRLNYYQFCRNIDSLNPSLYVGRRTMRLLYFRKVQWLWGKSIQGELAQRHLEEHNEYPDAVLAQVNEAGGALELYWLQKEESRGTFQAADEISFRFPYWILLPLPFADHFLKIHLLDLITAKNTTPTPGAGSLLQLDPSSLFDNWKVEHHYNTITYKAPLAIKKYSQSQHTRAKAGTKDSESMYKRRKRRELKDRWTVWVQKRGTGRSGWNHFLI